MMRAVALRVAQTLGGVPDPAPDVAEGIRAQQADTLTRLIPTKAALGAAIVAFLIFGFRPEHMPGLAWLSLVLMAGTYAALLRLCAARRRRGEEASGGGGFIGIYALLNGVLGTSWGVLVLSLMTVAEGSQRSLLYGLAVGLICTAALNAPVIVGVSFWLPVSVWFFVALAITGSAFDVTTTLCLLGCSFCAYFMNVTLNRLLVERARHQIELEEQREVIKLLLRDFERASADWLWETDDTLRLQNVSERLCQVTGLPAERLEGMPLRQLLGSDTALPRSDDIAHRTLLQCVSRQAWFAKLVLPVPARGEQRWWMLTGNPMFDRRGRFSGYRGVGSDITAARKSEEFVLRLARYDSLSDLPNRAMFRDLLTEACGRARAEGFAMLFLDLDDFKVVNDTLGHAAGDALLVSAAHRLTNALREIDVAARFGGDEFAAILPDAHPGQALACAERLIERLSQPYTIEGATVEVGVSIGVTIAPRDGTDPDLLLRNADLALYEAKAAGRGTARLYEPAMAENLRERQRMRADLRLALKRGEFRLAYQPIVSLAGGEVESVEVLLRWRHPTRGVLAPATFIPIAEEAGLIKEMGAWVLRQAALDAASWPGRVRVAVNLSPVQFRDPNLLATLDEAMSAARLPPERIELEVTESVLLEASEHTDWILRQLRGRGVGLVLDDFGTGHASLQYLRNFTFDKLKIDRSYVMDLEHDARGRVLVETIIALAVRMGMDVTAEGVESPEQLRLLREAGCTHAQGFLFQRPLEADQIGGFIARTERAA
jgi:diguanylate cyclase (GGDEF)-like protein/PAS domain S-box-containing protein